MRLSRFAPFLKKLCLRQNFLTVLPSDDFQPLVHLEELDLYDNKVKELGNSLDGMKELVWVSILPVRQSFDHRICQCVGSLIQLDSFDPSLPLLAVIVADLVLGSEQDI